MFTVVATIVFPTHEAPLINLRNTRSIGTWVPNRFEVILNLFKANVANKRVPIYEWYFRKYQFL